MTVDLASLLAGLGVKTPPKPTRDAAKFDLAVGVMREAQKMLLEMKIPTLDVLAANALVLSDIVAAATHPDDADRIIGELAETIKKDVAKKHQFLAGMGFTFASKPTAKAEDPAKPDADGWIKWIGGDCPIKDGVNFEFAFRVDNQPIKSNCIASDLRWSHGGNGGDIIRYRVL